MALEGCKYTNRETLAREDCPLIRLKWAWPQVLLSLNCFEIISGTYATPTSFWLANSPLYLNFLYRCTGTLIVKNLMVCVCVGNQTEPKISGGFHSKRLCPLPIGRIWWFSWAIPQWYVPGSTSLWNSCGTHRELF